MKSPPFVFRILLPLLAWVASYAAPEAGLAQDGFPVAEIEKFDWSGENLRLGFLKSQFTDALVGIATNFPKVSPTLKAKALAVARRANPTEKVAIEAHEALANGEKPPEFPFFEDARAIADQLHAVAQRFHLPSNNEDEQSFARYVNDIVLTFEKETGFNDEARELPRVGKAKWSRVLPDSDDAPASAPTEAPMKTTPATEAVPFKLSEASILVPVSQSAVASITASDLKQAPDTKQSVPSVKFEPGSAKGLPFSEHLDAALLQLKSHHSVFPNAQAVKIVLPETYDRADADAAQLGVLLAVDAMISGEAIEPTVAAFGSIDEEGKLVSTTSPMTHLTGEQTDLTPLIVPESIKDEILDLVLVAGITPFLSFEMISAADFEAARSLAQNPETETDYAEIVTVLRGDPEKYLHNSHVIEKLETLVERNSRHLSAVCLLAAAKKTVPTALSKQTSLTLTRSAAGPLLDHPEKAPSKEDLNPASFDQLKTHRKILAPETRAFAFAIGSYAVLLAREGTEDEALIEARKKVIAEGEALR